MRIENELINRIKRSDIAAFKELFERHSKPLTVFALNYIPDDDLAKDVVQDVFISFWENRKNIRASESGKALLYKSVKNLCLNLLKHESVKSKYADQALWEIKTMELAATDTQNSTFYNLVDGELQEKLDTALDQLPEERRKIFELSRFNGLKNAEIAKKLNISVRTVDTQIYRAVKALRDSLKDIL